MLWTYGSGFISSAHWKFGKSNLLNQDPRENLIRQWLSVDTLLGETAKELQLSQNPPLGAWKIIATVNVS